MIARNFPFSFSHLAGIVILIFFGWGFVRPVSAQPLQDPCIRELLPAYVRLVNDYMLGLHHRHESLEDFNFTLNEFYESSPSERRAQQLRYTHTPIFQQSELFDEFLPQQRYRMLETRHRCIPEPFASELMRYARQLKEISEELEGISARLAEYTAKRTYRNETELETPFSMLRRAYVLYHDVAVLKDALYYELNKLYREQEDIDFNTAYARSARSLMGVIVPIRSAMKSIKEGNDRRLESDLVQLRTGIAQAAERRQQNLAPLENSPVRYELIAGHYDFIVGVAEDFRNFIQEFAVAPTLDPRYEKHGRAYYYYNYRLLPLYNRTGEGLVQRYNALIALDDQALLGMVEEPAWLRIVPPGPQRKDEIAVAQPPTPSTPQPPATPDPKPEPQVVTKPDNPAQTQPLAAEEPEPRIDERAAANNWVLLLDVSSSMREANKLPLLQRGMTKLLEQMRPQDQVAVVVYSGKARTVLPPTPATEHDRILRAIENVELGGRTDALEGAVLAYRTAIRSFIEAGNNRIILASDGFFNIPEALPRLVAQQAQVRDVRLSVFFMGEDEARITDRLRRLAEIGRGNFRHLTETDVLRQMVEEASSVE